MKSVLPALLCLIVVAFTACDNKENYDINAGKEYSDAQEDLIKIEKRSPARFIRVTATNRKNFLGQMVVKGKIQNVAKVASFKDVTIKLKFYSQTGALLEEDVETIYQAIAPGETKSFKSKYFTPKGTDSLALEVTDAKH